jgi:hypothetical protein
MQGYSLEAPLWAVLILVAAAALLGLTVVLLLRKRYRRQTDSRVSRAVPAAMTPYLESPDGSLFFPLRLLSGQDIVVGRGTEGVDISIPDSAPQSTSVSLRHARIYFEDRCGHAVIEDLGSTNGVFVNGQRAPRKNLLKDRWTVTLGTLELVYRDGKSDTGPVGAGNGS